MANVLKLDATHSQHFTMKRMANHDSHFCHLFRVEIWYLVSCHKTKQNKFAKLKLMS